MSPTQVMLFAAVIIQIFGIIRGHITIIPERVNINYLNPKYVRYGTFKVRRYSRSSPYFLNLETEILQTWNNNVSYEMIFYERLGNEYKRSFVEMKFKLCDMLELDQFVGKTMKDAGLPPCPVPAAEYILHNMSVFIPQWKFVFPFQRARADSSFIITKTGELMANWDMYLTIVHTKKRKSSNTTAQNRNNTKQNLSRTLPKEH